MDLEIKQEFTQLRFELGEKFAQTDRKFEQIDQRFDQIDRRFEQIDRRFEHVDRRLDSHDEQFRKIEAEFRVVHASINKLAHDAHKKSLVDEERHATVLKMFDTMMHKLDALQDYPSVKSRVERHEVRISALESAARKNP